MTNTLTLGKVATWKAPDGEVKLADLRQAVTGAGLDPAVVHDMANRTAFNRAVKDLIDKNELVRKVEEGGEIITFQFTDERKQGGKLVYDERCIVYLNKTTGTLTGSDSGIVHKVQMQLNEHLDKRCPADITRLIQKIFDKYGGDLVPLRKQGGVYFVPDSNQDILDKVSAVLSAIGGELNTYTVSGDTSSKASVSSDMASHLRAMIDELSKSCEDVTMESKDSVIERRHQRFEIIKQKMIGYRGILAGYISEVDQAFSNAKQRFVAATTGQPAPPPPTTEPSKPAAPPPPPAPTMAPPPPPPAPVSQPPVIPPERRPVPAGQTSLA